MKKMLKVLFASLMLFTLVACGTPESQKALDDYLGTIKSGQFIEKTASQKEKVFVKLFQKMEYKILKTNETVDKSEIEVHIKAVNLAGYMADYIRAMMPLAFSGASEKAIDAAATKYFDDLSKSEDLSYIEQDVTVYLSKKDGKWTIDNGDELTNIVTGNLMEVLGEE